MSAIGHLIPSTYTGHIDIGTGEETSVLELAEAMGMGHLPIKEGMVPYNKYYGYREEQCLKRSASR